MSVLTKYSKLIKPELTDTADITAINQNWDVIDTEIFNLKAEIMARDTICFSDVTTEDLSINLLITGTCAVEFRALNPNGLKSLDIKTKPDATFDDKTFSQQTLVFKSGTTATVFTNTAEVYFTGDDCEEGIFTPVSNKIYELGTWWNGFGFHGVVRGV